MGPVWLQQFMQVTKEFIINLQHIFLLQVSILDLGLCTGGGGCVALYQYSKEVKRKVQGRKWHLHRVSDQHVWAEVCPLPVRCRAGDKQASLGREDEEQQLEVAAKSKKEEMEETGRFNLSVLDLPSVKAHLMCHTVRWAESGYHSHDVLC